MKIKNLKDYNNWKTNDVWPSDFVTDQLQTALFSLDYSGNVSKHSHKLEDILWYIVTGEGIVIVDGQEKKVREGDSFIIPKGIFHEAKTSKGQRMKILQVESIAFSQTNKMDNIETKFT